MASACVPALVKLIPNNLVADFFGDKAVPYHLLFLAGLCLVAAYGWRAFLNALTDRILKQRVAALEQETTRLRLELAQPKKRPTPIVTP